MFIFLDAVLVLASLLIAVRKKFNPALGVLFISSCVFIAHAFAGLYYGVSGTPDADVIYTNVSNLHFSHKVIGTLPLFYVSYYAYRYREHLFETLKNPAVYNLYVSALFIAFSLLPIFHVEYYDGYMQDVVAQIFFLALIPVFAAFFTVPQQRSLFEAYGYFLLLAALCLIVGLAQVLWLKVQAATNYEIFQPDYRLVVAYRASGIFLNPNWAANWAAIFGVVSAFLYQRGFVNCRALAGLAIAVVIIFLSGSRGGFCTLAVALTILLAFDLVGSFRKNLVLLATAVGVFALSNIAAGLAASDEWLGKRLYGLFYRWIIESVRLIVYILELLRAKITGGPMPVSPSSQISQSLTGRMEGGGADNGFLAFYHSSGILGVLAISIIVATAFVALCLCAARTGAGRKPPHLVSLAATSLVCVIVTAMQLRAFSVYPIWLGSAACFGLAFALVDQRAFVGAEQH